MLFLSRKTALPGRYPELVPVFLCKINLHLKQSEKKALPFSGSRATERNKELAFGGKWILPHFFLMEKYA